jgi:hypothetical protein
MAVLRFLVAIPLGLAPRRYWQSLDVHLPVTRRPAPAPP